MTDPRPAGGASGSALARSFWVLRAWTALPLLVFLTTTAALRPSAAASVAVLAMVAASSLAAYATRGLAAALRDGDRGELLMRSGARVPFPAWTALYRAEQLEIAVAAATVGPTCVALALDGAPHTVLAGAGVLFLAFAGLLHWQRRASQALVDAMAALADRDLDRAEARLRAIPALPSLQHQVRQIRAQIAQYRGRPEQAAELLEAGYTGVLDDRAALLGLVRLGRGDPELAVRWLATPPADDRYSRYLRALVAARVALSRGAWEEALVHARDGVDLPSYYARQLRLVEAAALQGAGSTARAQGVLQEIGGIERDRWLVSLDPAWYGLLADAVDGRPTRALRGPAAPSVVANAGAAPVADPFAAPRGAAPIRRRTRGAGALPVESLVLVPARTRLRRVTLGLSGLTLVGSGLLLTPIGLLLRSFADATDPLARLSLLGGPFALVMGALVLADAAYFPPGGGPSVALSDGRRIARRGFWLWATGSLGQLALLAALAVGLLVAAGSGSVDLGWMWAIVVPFGVLLGWVAVSRWRLLRLVRAAHFDPPGEALVRAERAVGRGVLQALAARQWLALARLWVGDAEGAERELDRILADAPWLDGLKNWFRAGRGDLELPRALAEPEPAELGERYRWAVTVALAALRAGRPELVRDRARGWMLLSDELPNRYGALLSHLAARVAGHARVRDPDLAWIDAVWPFAA